MCTFRVLPAKKSLQKLVSRVVKSVLVLSRVTFWGEVVLWTFVFFFFLGNLIKVLCLLAKVTRPSCQNWFYVSRRSFFMLEKLKYAQMCSFCVLTAKRICENFLADLSKVHLSCPQQQFEKTIFLISCFFSFWVFECKIYALWQNKLIEIVKTSFTVIAGFLMKIVFLQIFEVFSTLLHFEQNVPSLFVGKGGMVVKTEFYVSRKSIFLLKFWNIHKCFYFSRVFWAFSWEKAQMVVKTEFYLSRTSIFLLKFWNIHKCLHFLYLQPITVCENFLAELSKVYLYEPH